MSSILSSSTIRQRAKKGSIYTGPLMPTSVCHTKYSFGRHQVKINGPTKTDKYLTTEKYDGMIQIHTHTHTPHLTALCTGLPGWAGTRKVKPIWILLKQKTVCGSGIRWAICTSAPRSSQIYHASTPPLSFLQAGCPSCRPTNSVKAPKATNDPNTKKVNQKMKNKHSYTLLMLNQ